ncbi:hypothetical protein LINGRAHAP2_LOCUS8035, partial [Linum grandiflorum]
TIAACKPSLTEDSYQLTANNVSLLWGSNKEVSAPPDGRFTRLLSSSPTKLATSVRF